MYCKFSYVFSDHITYIYIQEIEAEWITDCIDYLRDNNLTYIEPSLAAEEEWSKKVDKIFSTQLFQKVASWYTGANVPGKTVQSLNFTGGVPAYIKCTKEVAEKGYEGFILRGDVHEAKANF